MSVRVVVGAQWGDEGKGKIVDLLSSESEVVARFQGGANAGHTVVVNGRRFILHLLPSGILHPHVRCYIGNGVVVDPEALLQEMEFVEKEGIEIGERLIISGNAHVILPYHRLLDQQRESVPELHIGTTGRGIGPAYVDKYDRIGIRMVDLLDAAGLRNKLEINYQLKGSCLGGKLPDLEETLETYLRYGDRLRERIRDVSLLLQEDIRSGRRILLEGAQGTLLDVDFGTYPFVTSSNPIAGSACVGLGIGPTQIDAVLGVFKAYTTRVGAGPFPTEFEPDFAERVRQAGGEFGATTGRPRRCGWFDGILARFAARVNGLTEIAITKLDVLDDLEEIRVCVAYNVDGTEVEELPTDLSVMERCQPRYETLPGWRSPTSDARRFEELPANARAYLRFLEEWIGVPVRIVSVGSDRKQTIFRD
jgi:adenylosuccinate synthase